MPTANGNIGVVIVDDSALVRKVLTEILDGDPGVEVLGAAADPHAARSLIKEVTPDVLTLDVEMPKMDGITFLSNLMRLRPMPVVMVSSLTEPGADVTLTALEIGAVDFVHKPKLDVAHGLEEYAEELLNKVKVASKARPRGSAGRPGPRQVSSKQLASVMSRVKATDRLLAIGASTGGTEAIREVLSTMPPDGPPTVITQHIPEAFSLPFAKRLNDNSALNVCQAEDGQQIVPGHGYVAPGNRHLRVVRDGARLVCRLDDGPAINRHKPSVDALFNSVASEVGVNAIAVLLTGMGADGAVGLQRIQEAGGKTMAQDEATSVVWGMPGEAVRIGAADEQQPLGKVTARVLELLT
jgi:two-component system chemotaxis response regulator CheB